MFLVRLENLDILRSDKMTVQKFSLVTTLFYASLGKIGAGEPQWGCVSSRGAHLKACWTWLGVIVWFRLSVGHMVRCTFFFFYNVIILPPATTLLKLSACWGRNSVMGSAGPDTAEYKQLCLGSTWHTCSYTDLLWEKWLIPHKLCRISP